MAKPSLKDALSRAAARQGNAHTTSSALAQSYSIERRTQPPSPGRQGKKAVAGFFDPAVSRLLKQIGIERDTSIQELLGEAINDLFSKHGQRNSSGP